MRRSKRWRAVGAIVAALAVAFSLTVGVTVQAQEGEETEFGEAAWRTHLNLGKNDIRQGRYEDAIRSFEDALRLNPNAAEAYNGLGESYFGQKRYEDAIAAFKEAVRLNPTFADAYNNLGATYFNQGNPKAAVASLGQALRLRPNLTLAHLNLGWVYAALGDRRKAWAEYWWLRGRDPNKAIKLYSVIAAANAASSVRGAATARPPARPRLDLQAVRIEPSRVVAGSSVLVKLDYTVEGAEKTIREERRIEKDGKVLARFLKSYRRSPGRHLSKFRVSIPGVVAPGTYSIVGTVADGELEMSRRATLRVTAP